MTLYNLSVYDSFDQFFRNSYTYVLNIISKKKKPNGFYPF